MAFLAFLAFPDQARQYHSKGVLADPMGTIYSPIGYAIARFSLPRKAFRPKSAIQSTAG